MTNLRCSTNVLQALEYLWVQCGAYIIDEAPQGAAALYHAVALRSSYARASAHKLELAEYADPNQSFGAIPNGIECGDELQLPPVPASAGPFAVPVGASTELPAASTRHLQLAHLHEAQRQDSTNLEQV